MKFDKVIRSLLEGNNNELALVCKDHLIKVGTVGLLKDILGDHMYDRTIKDYKTIYNSHRFQTVWEPLINGEWELYSIDDRVQEEPNEILLGVSKDVRERLSAGIIKKYTIRIKPVLTKETIAHPGRDGTWIAVYQTSNKDGVVTTWYPHRETTTFLEDLQVTSLKDHEIKTTITAHKDHNELVDLIDL
jgi:hypothetical protein